MNTVSERSVSLFSLTPGGQQIARRLRQALSALSMHCYCAEKYLQAGFLPFDGNLKQTVAQRFHCDHALIFIGACGIAVRMIAPLLKDKFTDPGVLVIDEQGQFVISLLSGHIGGANELARQVADSLGAQPVISTATDVNQTCAFDLLAQQLNAASEQLHAATKTVNQLLVSGHTVGLYIDPWLEATLGFDIRQFDIRGLTLVTEHDVARYALSALIDVSMQVMRPDWPIPSFQLIPRRLVAGIGCRKNVSSVQLLTLFQQQLQRLNIHPLAVAAIGSIDLKCDEPALQHLAQQYQVPFKLFSAAELSSCSAQFPQSEFVQQTVGVGCVSQPAAWLLSDGCLLGETLRQQGITLTYGVMKSCYMS
ncbi:cobalt-precorrin 5A hydrolase [Vibrio gazogenes]|uniref:Cobalt-precorrin 5A acetaldehyde-lyase n=1 Tax=Vibrio gazogenes DSM 21264 = NBRC 103151 TaxID=1123492 RepID=A0A1M4USY9_VIBGA|nr:cobalt-precorrin 5A hydrolase [Vibrio gazogenes]USP15688.1 cobalt-precorrin 5A hydrolase [Vibrio gazogenes]SHE59733.1 cobalt-precorrin 5A acetaldehyde-lyase [Vibrio gazogenes DSM 21264] [Vibrio gazogenes DSM 21264 = NBRC 103151]SJN56167.1 cobalamin biosynthesis protein CbiG [Vibrio gazogenes]